MTTFFNTLATALAKAALYLAEHPDVVIGAVNDYKAVKGIK